MAVTSDDNVPGAPGDDDDDAGETTAATKAPAAGALAPVAVDGGAHEDDRTVRRNVDARLLRAEHAAKVGGRPAPRDARAGAGVRMTSKKATVQGLGMPGLPSRRSQPPPPLLHEAEEAEDSITATAPGLPPGSAAPSAPSIVPKPSTGVVKITELEEEGDETEVRTVITTVASATPGRLPRPAPAAGRPPAPTMPDEGPDAIDDSVTAQAPSPVRSPADEEPKTQPPVLSPVSPRSPAASTVDDYDTDESVTGRAPAVPYDDDDSITAEGPAVPPTPSKLAPPRIRVLPTLGEDEPPDNRTAVMANAPVKPFPLNRTVPMQRSTSAVAASRPDPSSDSGLRIAPNRLDAAEKASVNVLLAGMPPAVHDTNPFAATTPVFSPLDPASLAPVAPPVGAAPAPTKASSYALIVGVVAGASVAIPLVVYLALKGSAPSIAPETREPATFEHEPVGLVEEPLTKAARTPPPTPSATTTAKPPWWRRR